MHRMQAGHITFCKILIFFKRRKNFIFISEFNNKNSVQRAILITLGSTKAVLM